MHAMNLIIGAREPTFPPLQEDLETVVGVSNFRAEAVAERL